MTAPLDLPQDKPEVEAQGLDAVTDERVEALTCPKCDSERMEGTGLYVCGRGIRGIVEGGCSEYYTAKLIRSLRARLEAAEKELARAERQRDEARTFLLQNADGADDERRRAESAEAQVRELQEALRDIERAGHVGPNALSREGMMARDALSREWEK